MNEETLWVLKMLSEKRLSAKMANRLLYALELLRKSEEGQNGESEINSTESAPEKESIDDIGQHQDSVQEIDLENSGNADPEINEEQTKIEPEPLLEDPIDQNLTSPDLIGDDIQEPIAEQQDSEENQGKTDEYAESSVDEALETSTVIDEDVFEETMDAEILSEESSTEPSDSDENQQDQAEELESEEEPIEGSNSESDSPTIQENMAEIEDTLEALAIESDEKVQKQFEENADDVKEDGIDLAIEDEPVLIQENGLTKQQEEQREEPVIAEKNHQIQDYLPQSQTHDDQDGSVYILPVNDDTGIIFNNENGNITIQGWEQDQLEIQGNDQQIEIYQEGNKFNIDINGDGEFTFCLPPSVARVRLFSASGNINIDNHSCDMFVSNSTGDIYVKDSRGILKAKTTAGNIAVEDYRGNLRLQSESGSILVRNVSDDEDARKSNDLGKTLKGIVDHAAEVDDGDSSRILEIDAQTESGDIALEDISGSINVRGNGEVIRLRKCRGQSIVAESKAGKIDLIDVATNINLIVENSEIVVDDFFGNLNIDSKNTPITLMKSGDAQIHIDSSDGDIKIEDCYADVNINSGKGDVYIAGGNLSFAAMGKIDLKMKDGNAYLNRRTFENISIAIDKGDAEINMEKLNSGGKSNVKIDMGNIALRVSPEFRFDLEARASKKKIHLGLPVSVIEKDRNSMRGTLNNGGAKVSLSAPEGEIFVQALED